MHNAVKINSISGGMSCMHVYVQRFLICVSICFLFECTAICACRHLLGCMICICTRTSQHCGAVWRLPGKPAALTSCVEDLCVKCCGVLSVSLCLSDGCEGQSLLAVSESGLSLSPASLFSGICRQDVWWGLHSYAHCGPLPSVGRLMAPIQTDNGFLSDPSC